MSLRKRVTRLNKTLRFMFRMCFCCEETCEIAIAIFEFLDLKLSAYLFCFSYMILFLPSCMLQLKQLCGYVDESMSQMEVLFFVDYNFSRLYFYNFPVKNYLLFPTNILYNSFNFVIEAYLVSIIYKDRYTHEHGFV